ncbi:MAG: hypothetical protein IJ186_02230 [Bacilli bacterium]|nr:hypothetical protein [Bacilli bacterium]
MDLQNYNKAGRILYFIGFAMSCLSLIVAIILTFDMIFKAISNEPIIYSIHLFSDYYLDLTRIAVQEMITGYTGIVFSIMGLVQGLKMKQGEPPSLTITIVILVGSIFVGSSLTTLVGSIIVLIFINKLNRSKAEAEARRNEANKEVITEEPVKEEINQEFEIQENNEVEPPIIK